RRHQSLAGLRDAVQRCSVGLRRRVHQSKEQRMKSRIAAALLMAMSGATARADDLAGQLKTFLTGPTFAKRAAARKAVLATPGLTHQRLEAERGKLDLWSDVPVEESPLKLDFGKDH